MRRTLGYTDDLFHVLASYQANAVLSAGATAALYPFARLGVPVLEGVGLVGNAQAEPRIHTTDSTGKQYNTTSSRWEVGAGERLIFGPLELGLYGLYGSQSFSVELPGQGVSPIPAVDYVFWAPELRMRVALGDRFFVLASAAYLVINATGEIGSAARFPRLDVGGVEGQLGMGVRVTGPWELRLVADYRRYYYTMNPQPGDPYVAGGALDQYSSLLGGIAARWP
jgi:hypothetical protein